MRFPHQSTWFAMVSERPEVCWCTPSCWSGHDCTNTATFGNIFHFRSQFPFQFPAHFQALLLEPNRPELHLGCPLFFFGVWSITVKNLFQTLRKPGEASAWCSLTSWKKRWIPLRQNCAPWRAFYTSNSRSIATMLWLSIPYTRDSLCSFLRLPFVWILNASPRSGTRHNIVETRDFRWSNRQKQGQGNTYDDMKKWRSMKIYEDTWRYVKMYEDTHW